MSLAALSLAAVLTRVPAFVPPPILMYHRIDSDRPRDALGRSLTLEPAQLDAQLSFLKARGVRVISMEQLYRRVLARLPLDRTVVATFDDGYADQYEYAVPLLRRYGWAATFYVVTGTLGRRGHLDWPALAAMTKEGMDVAAHGVAHDDLSLMTPPQQRYQIDGSVRMLRRRLGVPVDSYAYPSGRFNRNTLALVREAGVPLAVTTDRLYVLPPETSLEIPRVRVRGEWTVAQFWKAVSRAWAVPGVAASP